MRCSKLIAVCLILGSLLGACSRQKAVVALPVIGTLPAFSLEDQDRKLFSLHTMAGKVWIADFIFTRCPSMCPRLTQNMRTVQLNFMNDSDKISFASFTVDPDYDNPTVLKDYAERYDVDEDSWRFVTGDIVSVKQAVVEGFKVAIDARGDKSIDIVHANNYVLVDKAGRIRGYYPSDPPGMTRLIKDARTLF